MSPPEMTLLGVLAERYALTQRVAELEEESADRDRYVAELSDKLTRAQAASYEYGEQVEPLRAENLALRVDLRLTEEERDAARAERDDLRARCITLQVRLREAAKRTRQPRTDANGHGHPDSQT